MPLTFEKCGVIYCGAKQPNYIYSIHDHSMTFYDSFEEVMVIRFSNGLHNGQCQAAATNASKITSAIRRVFWGSHLICYGLLTAVTSYQY